jgi:hypothetical protein
MASVYATNTVQDQTPGLTSMTDTGETGQRSPSPRVQTATSQACGAASSDRGSDLLFNRAGDRSSAPAWPSCTAAAAFARRKQETGKCGDADDRRADMRFDSAHVSSRVAGAG